MLPAAFAAEYGQPDITVQTTIKQIRENPSIAGSGIYVYGNSDEHCRLLQACFENETVAQYLGEPQAEDGAKGLNMVIRNYNAGVQVTWPVYTAEEIAAVPARGDAELYYFPAEQPGAKYAIVMGGNVATTSGELREGVTSVPQLHERGYVCLCCATARFWMLPTMPRWKTLAGRYSSSRNMPDSSGCRPRTTP